jgi:hypothetical protein
MYEQDWLDTEYDNVVVLNTNATAARTWLMQMGTASERNDITIQYCMSHCRHIMQSLEVESSPSPHPPPHPPPHPLLTLSSPSPHPLLTLSSPSPHPLLSSLP